MNWLCWLGFHNPKLIIFGGGEPRQGCLWHWECDRCRIAICMDEC